MPNLLQCTQSEIDLTSDIVNQRKTIISLLEQMINVVHGSKKPSQDSQSPDMNSIISELNDVAINYFNSTEVLLKDSECSQLTSYQREHRLFLAEFKKYYRNFKENPINLHIKDVKALKTWFVTHAVCGPCKHG